MATAKKERKDVYEQTTERMLNLLEEGIAPWRQPWTAGTLVPRNANSKRPYRGYNALVTMFSGYASPNWATYDGWQKLGGQVLKGEKATYVVGWKTVDRKVTEEDEETGVTKTKTKRHLVGFGYRVFNEAQVAMSDEDKAKLHAKDPVAREHEPVAAAELIFDHWTTRPDGCPISYGHAGASYMLRGDEVKLPALRDFESPEAFASTGFHELGHATGNPKRLGRWKETDIGIQATFGSESYSKEELVAEFTAAFVNATIGIEAQQEEASAAYLQHWASKLREDPKLLISAASRAQKAADFILEGVFDEAEEGDDESPSLAARDLTPRIGVDIRTGVR